MKKLDIFYSTTIISIIGYHLWQKGLQMKLKFLTLITKIVTHLCTLGLFHFPALKVMNEDTILLHYFFDLVVPKILCEIRNDSNLLRMPHCHG